jgi:hypothetical protein
MSGDEGFALVVSAVLGFILRVRWYWFIVRCPGGPGALLAFVPPICAAGLFVVLRRWAAHDVRDDPTYLMMYMVMGAAWVGICARLFPAMALNVREDVINRRNPASAWLAAGAMCGVAACFAGANVGEGPGWWVVVFAGALATAGLFVAWAVM